jgi:hypothetical protein
MEADLKRIAEIDSMFEQSKSWGSWMVMAANEREALVNKLRAAGHAVEHKWLVRTPDRSPVD